MPTTPVYVATWLDPPEQSSFAVGASVTWHAAFADRITRQLVSPDIVTFSTSNPPVSSTPVPTTMVATSVGQYQMDFPITSAGLWILDVQAQGNPGAVNVGTANLKIQARNN